MAGFAEVIPRSERLDRDLSPGSPSAFDFSVSMVIKDGINWERGKDDGPMLKLGSLWVGKSN